MKERERERERERVIIIMLIIIYKHMPLSKCMYTCILTAKRKKKAQYTYKQMPLSKLIYTSFSRPPKKKQGTKNNTHARTHTHTCMRPSGNKTQKH